MKWDDFKRDALSSFFATDNGFCYIFSREAIPGDFQFQGSARIKITVGQIDSLILHLNEAINNSWLGCDLYSCLYLGCCNISLTENMAAFVHGWEDGSVDMVK